MEGMGEKASFFSRRATRLHWWSSNEPTDPIFTNEFSGVTNRFLTRDQAVERIEAFVLAPNATSVLCSNASKINWKGRRTPASAYIFSDLQASTHGLSAELPPIPRSSGLYRNWRATP